MICDLHPEPPRGKITRAIGLTSTKGDLVARRHFQRGSVCMNAAKTAWVGYVTFYSYDSNGVCHRWRQQIFLGYVKHPDGTKMTKSQAKTLLEPHVAKANASAIAPVAEAKNMPLKEFISKVWEPDYLSLCKPSYIATAKGHAKRLVAELGTKEMRSIEVSDFQRVVSKMVEEGYAPKTVKNLWSTTCSIWGAAGAQGYVQGLPKPKLPKAPRTKARCFSLKDVAKIIAASSEEEKVLFWLAAETGLRAGELFGLYGYCIEDSCIDVRWSLWHGRMGTPKTPSSVRKVAISRQLKGLLQTQAKRQKRIGDLCLFTNDDGHSLDACNFRRRRFAPLLKDLSIEPAGFHAFRHFNASQLSRLRTPLKTIQERLGHASTGSLTLDVYIHAEWEDNVEAAQALGDVIEKAVNSCSLIAVEEKGAAA